MRAVQGEAAISNHLLERDDVLHAVDAAAQRARQGAGSVLVVSGQAGIGKTQLLRAAGAEIASHGMRLRWGTGGELEHDLPFGVVRQLVADCGRSLAQGPAAIALGLAPASTDIGWQDLEPATFNGLYDVCSQVANDQPTTMVVDDVHWADTASLRFLLFLSRRLARLPLLLLVGLRSGAGEHDRALDLLLADPAVVWQLRPLSVDAVGRLLRLGLGQEPDDAFARQVHQATQGNPFLVHGLVGELARGGVPPTAASIPVLKELASRNVAQAVLGRVAAISPAAVAIAENVAVLGKHASVPSVAQLAGLTVADVEDGIDAMVSDGVLLPGVSLSFQHPLVASAVYRRMGAATRARRHGAVARLLSDAGAPAEDVCAHLLASEPNADPWVVQTLRSGAQHALAVGSPQLAVRLFRRALAEPAGDKRALLLLNLAHAESLCGEPDTLEHALQAVAAADNPILRGNAAVLAGWLLTFRRRYQDAFDLLDRAMRSLGDQDPELRRRLQATWIWVAQTAERPVNEYRHQLDEVDPSLPGATVGERLLLVHLAAIRMFDCAHRDEAATLARRALADGKLLAEETSDSPAWHSAANVLADCGYTREAAELFAAGVREARTRGSETGEILSRVQLARCLVRLGKLAEAEAEALAALAVVGMDRRGAAWQMAVGVLGLSLTEQGRLDDAARALADAHLPPEGPTDRRTALLYYVRGLQSARRSDWSAAVDDWTRVGEWADRHEFLNPALWSWRTDTARALAALGRHPEGRTLIQPELDRARRFASPVPLGRALHAAALVSQPTDAALLTEAVAVLSGGDAPLALAEAEADAASVRLGAGDVTGARDLLRGALSRADAAGAQLLVARLQAELRDTGARPRRTATTGVAALTDAERSVARLAAQGMTNREVAGELYLSVKTVEKHLRNTYQKLGVTGRAELRAVLASEEGDSP